MTALESEPAPSPTAYPASARDGELLRARALSVRYEGAAATTPSAVSFSVSPGDVLLVLGPSGCGKSTLTLTLNGLIPHAVPAEVTGVVEVNGVDAASASVAEASRHVAMVFQDPDAQLVTGTLLDEVSFGPENLRMPVAEVLERAETALRRVGLWERRDENPDRLSGGGRQRLAIACALAMGSPVLVLDEPTANLDPGGIDDVYAALGDVVATGDRAIVLVEHDLDAAVGLATRVLVLDAAGRVTADGPVDEVLRTDAERLHALGVWLPTATLAALRLRRAGYDLDPLPLTARELRGALEALDPPRAAPPARGRRRGGAPAQPRPGQALVTVTGLTVDLGRRRVLQQLDLGIQAGEFVAIVGANGAGKTTLLQSIAGVRRPPRGTVTVDGMDVGRADARTLSSRIGFVFQNPEHQFIAPTVFDELAHGLRLRRVPEDRVRERVGELLERFGLADRAHLHPFLLSGGQKRRLSVGTALVAGARLLALDEPTFGQDRARADELLGLLRELNDEGTTILIVTHDMQLVTEHADRTVVLADGRLLRDGRTADIFADDELLRRAGLRPPPLAVALRGLARHPGLSDVSRVADLPGTDGPEAAS